MPFRGLGDSLNQCILRAVWDDLLRDPWHTNDNPPVLDIRRVCDGVGYSMFIASLWVDEFHSESILREQINRLNNVKVRIDQFIEVSGAYSARVPGDIVKVWESISKDWIVSHENDNYNSNNNNNEGMDIQTLTITYCYLKEILHLSDPSKLIEAIGRCDPSLHWSVCKLYSDELDAAVEYLSRQIDRLRQDVFEQTITNNIG